MELGSIGMFFQISALILCLASVAAYIYAYITKSYNIKSIGNWLFIGTTIAIIIASLVHFGVVRQALCFYGCFYLLFLGQLSFFA